jgi:low affinity Fe/Cu permease
MRKKHPPKEGLFYKIARNISEAVGSSFASIAAVTLVIFWAITGPIFKFSDAWVEAINTGTAIVTFLLVFLIQNSQNRDAKAVQIKLDELIRAIDSARNEVIDVENSPDEELQKP